MKAHIRIRCEGCNRLFTATRRDSKYCSHKCRERVRMENAKFELPRIPKSGVPGVTYSRVRKRWEVRVPEDRGRWKYAGSFGTLPEAAAFRKQLGASSNEAAQVSVPAAGQTLNRSAGG
jgi:hypothetical protein